MDPIRLTAGLLTMSFEPWSGMVRHVRFAGREVLRGAYAVVRRGDWSTIPHQVEDVHSVQDATGFKVTWHDVNGPVTWEGSLTGDSNGVEYRMRGIATEEFETNRTGLCILHPAKESRGARVIVEHVDGSTEIVTLPETILPTQPVFDIRSLTQEVLPGLWLEMDLTGDTFEMEDQRNWSDASFKTYCRPHRLPKPFTIPVDERIEHAVRFRLIATEAAGPPVSLTSVRETLPFSVGTLVLADTDVAELAKLDLGHYAVKVDFSKETSGFEFAREVAATTGRPVHLLVSRGSSDQVKSALEALPDALAMVEDNALLAALSGVERVFTGTSSNFTELNGQRPNCEAVTGVGFATNAQVHAFDDVSIKETLEGLEHTVESALAICPGKPVAVGPIRFGPEDDARIQTPFGAAWAVSAVWAVARAGASSATILTAADLLSPAFETALKALQGISKGQALATSDPLRVHGFRVGEVVWLASLSDRAEEVDLDGVSQFDLQPFEVRSFPYVKA